MRTRKRRIVDPVQPSLVPMVDLLSNTVGALVFIMIFTVMAASGVVVLKRLPLEHSSKAEPINFLCERDRIIPLDNLELDAQLKRRWGRPYSIFDLSSWIARFDGIEVEDQHFIARGESSVSYSSYSFSILFTAKPNGGYARADLQSPNSEFRRRLAGLNPKTHFAHFFVRPDSIDSFFVGRQIAADEMGLGTGWMPLEQSQALRFVSRGRSATEQ
jgi:hypothetical protein